MVEIAPVEGQTRLISDVFADAETRKYDWMRVDNYALAAVDTTATSLAWIASLGTVDIASIVPEAASTYHRSRGLYDTVSSIPMIFVGVGAATKASRAGGWLETSLKNAGLGEKSRAFIFSDVAKTMEYDNLMQAARSSKAVGVAQTTGMTTPNLALSGPLDEGAGALRTLTGASSYEDAAAWASRFTTRNSVREGLAQEMTLFATMNQSEFMFPEDAGITSYLGFGALGVGLNVAVDTAVRRAVARKSMAQAARYGAEVAQQVRETNGYVTHGNTTNGVVGDQWGALMASAYGLERLDVLENSADAIVAAAGGGLARQDVINEVGKLRLALAEGQKESFGKIFKSRINNTITRNGTGNTPAVSVEYVAKGSDLANMTDRIKKNPRIGVVLAELGDNKYVTRWGTLHETINTEITAAQKNFDGLKKGATPNEVSQAQSAVDTAKAKLRELQKVRPATIESTGQINYNGNRKVPYWEQPDALGDLQITKTTMANPRSNVHIDHRGQLNRADHSGYRLSPQKETSLSFEEMTSMYTLVARGGNNPQWSERFWGNYSTDPNIKLTDLPAAILDAIHEGKLKIPETVALSPKIQQLQNARGAGFVQAISIAKKLDWWKEQHAAQAFGDTQMDLMDAEKALNLRLTDDRGYKNALGDAFEAFAAAKSSASAIDFMVPTSGRANDAFDALFDLGVGYAGTHQFADTLRPGFDEGLKGIDALTLHEGAKGKTYGALYHKVDMPTDSELQVAKIMAVRNSMRMDTLTSGPSEFVNEMAFASMENQIAFNGAAKITEMFNDTMVKGNTFTTTTWKHRFQKPLQHAAAVDKNVTAAMDRIANDKLLPLAEDVKSIARSPEWAQTAPQLAIAHQLVSRGFSLAEDGYKVGLNALDTSRPGAQRLLDELGPLKGAPDEGDTWHLFDVSIAANEGRYVPINLTEASAHLLNRYADVSHYQFQAMNALRKSSGLPALDRLPGHLPVMNFNRYKLRYMQDPVTGKIEGFIKAKTDREADQELQRALQNTNARRKADGKSELQEATLDEIKSHYDAIDEMFMHNLRDFSGIKQSGTAGGKNADLRLDVSTDLVSDMMIAMRNTFTDLKRRTVASVMAEPINEARNMLRRLKGNASGVADQSYFNAIQQWENVLLGDGRLPKESLEAKVHATAEQLANTAIGKIGEVLPYVWRSALAKENGFATPAQAKFAEQVTAAHAPMTHLTGSPELAKYLKVGEHADPYRLATALQMGNKAATSMLLKIANVAHPILTYASTAVTAPAVIKWVQPMNGETADEWAMRVGPITDYLDYDKGLATINPAKLLIEGFELSLRDTAAIEHATRRGMINANMLEELNAVNSIRPSKFTEAMEAAAKWSDFINVWLTPLQRKITGKEPSAFTLTERAETGARSWVHMMGYAIARRGGKDLTEAQRHSFAHYFANQNIADFSPNLRGQAFRGVAGIPFGLFQSFSINLYQRLFSYVENRAHRALVTQAATQVGMFGVAGLPGWNQLNAAYFQTKDSKADETGATTLNERIYNNLGKGWADLLMAGSLSNLPKLAGGGAINMYTSADMNLRAGGIPPAISLGQQMVEGVVEGAKRGVEEVPKIFTGENFDGGRLMEVLANYAPSRGHRSLVDLALGEKVDKNGNLVVEDTWRGTSLLARALGTRTHDELMTSSAIWDNAQAQSQRFADMDRVRGQILRTLRSGEATEQDMAYWLADYISAGGNAEQWNRWMAYTSDKAKETRGDRAFAKVVTKAGEILPHNFASAKRLEMAGVKPDPKLKGEDKGLGSPTIP